MRIQSTTRLTDAAKELVRRKVAGEKIDRRIFFAERNFWVYAVNERREKQSSLLVLEGTGDDATAVPPLDIALDELAEKELGEFFHSINRNPGDVIKEHHIVSWPEILFIETRRTVFTKGTIDGSATPN